MNKSAPAPEWTWKRSIITIAILGAAALMTRVLGWPSWTELLAVVFVIAGSFIYDMFIDVCGIIDGVRNDLYAKHLRQAEWNLAVASNYCTSRRSSLGSTRVSRRI